MEAKSVPTLQMPGEILDRLSDLYPKLAEGVPGNPVSSLDLPSLEELFASVSGSSFKVFDDPVAYEKNLRAKSYPSWSSSRLIDSSSDIYRIYFNDYSRKIYVDLNGTRLDDLRTRIEDELLYCEILRTLIFVLVCGRPFDPDREETAADGPAEIATILE